MATKQTLNIVRGKTLSLVIRWEDASLVVAKPITAISFASGFPRLTVTSHGVTDGWRGYCTSVQGTKQINTEDPSRPKLRETLVIDPNTLEFNGWNPVDDNGRDWAAYTSGGFFKYNTPKSLANKTVRVKVKDKVGGTVLLSTEVGDAPLNLITATVDDAAKTITVVASDLTTQAITWDKGVWEVEAYDTAALTTEPVIAVSPVVVSDEVVTP
jgi:hypothetical protein